MAGLANCWCDQPSSGGLTTEPCTRKATQEDMVCDQCRTGCNRISVGPPDAKPEEMRVLDAHGQVSVDGDFPIFAPAEYVDKVKLLDFS